ncbi:MAG: hypothetical protein E5Y06_23315 [Mesorhizobium sp.]|uniref:TrlF family AAA-like ATPase n=1 Tax=Mesorhizobium sp. TaxID=1871066 RepID=UPI001210AB8C|nr:AAA family ATPase [Mesorhizobium sp.]TIN92444.1 MAG: hypothetical protein E5Y06_23315 [Mesorhizobium sp.]TJU97833.1 MAG: hypothetical protein E5Y08_15620 [Mesorhizobium sp.]
MDSTTADDETSPVFLHGSRWIRADFHLHTRADKEFAYNGEDNAFVSSYVDQLAKAAIGLGVITNHNKFDFDEFKALRRRARRQGIGLLPGVELSVNDGANGVHTLIVFSDAWIAEGQDYINQFLTNAFTGKTRAQYEHENARSNDDLINTLRKLEGYNRDFFVIFAHVEAPSGLWNELDGGRLTELAEQPLIKKYCLGFQKVRTHDKADAKSRMKVRQWWPRYPAEVEGSDPKRIEEIGRGRSCFVKLGDLGFDAVKFALTDFPFRVAAEVPVVSHSHVEAIRFEGGMLDGVRVPFSPHMNCLIGIQGSGKSSVLECLRYALDIPYGEKPQDKEYKDALVPYVLKSGGTVAVEVTDRLGTKYEVRRILNHAPDVYIDGVVRHGVSIRETVIRKPLYFGQKDLSAAGKGFGVDLVEKLVGDSLKTVRQKIATAKSELKGAIDALNSVQTDVDTLSDRTTELEDIKYRLEQFDKHGVKATLEKQLGFSEDEAFFSSTDVHAEEWRATLAHVIEEASDAFSELEVPASSVNEDLFARYAAGVAKLKQTITAAGIVLASIDEAKAELAGLHEELKSKADGLKEEFAQTERDLVQALAAQGVTSIQPDAYVGLTERRATVEADIAELTKRTLKEWTRRDALLTIISTLNDGWLDEFKQVSASLAKINAAQPALKIQPVFKGDKVAFRDKLEEVFRGSGVRKEVFLDLAADYADFGAIYKDIEKAAEYARTKSEAFKEYLLDNLPQLLAYQVPNSFDVTYHGKGLKSHSLGQRASAMMLFLLSQDDHDLLLIDQPEDDLDSQTVYEEVVKLVRQIKSGRQFIFATHNANFPVLGDAESVSAFSATDEAIEVFSASIDNKLCQAKIVDIMEGGPEAFARRKTIYEIWNT